MGLAPDPGSGLPAEGTSQRLLSQGETEVRRCHGRNHSTKNNDDC